MATGIEAARRTINSATEPRAATINIRAELNAVPGLIGRTPETPVAELDAVFGRSFPYRDGIISTIKFSGFSAWERHAGDEIVIVCAGEGCLHIRLENGRTRPQSLSKDIMVIVPQDQWHRIESDQGISLLTITPQPTDHE